MLSCCGTNPSAMLQGVLSAVIRLLDPAMEEASAAYVGQLIDTLVQKVPTAMNSFIPKLIEALVQKLQQINTSQVSSA